MSGQRRYDDSVLYRLAVVPRAQEAGFTLEEIRVLFFFGVSPSVRVVRLWNGAAILDHSPGE